MGRGFVDARTSLLDKSAILSRDTPVGQALQAVVQSGLVFLAGPVGITEFVVVSDLDRHAVRCYLFVLICELEMRLADAVDAALGDEGVRRVLLPGGLKEYEKVRARGSETRAVEYLYFSQYRELVRENRAISASFPGRDHTGLPSLLADLNRLRNVVAHPSSSLLSRFEPADIAQLAALTSTFVEGLRAAPSSLADEWCSVV